MMPMLPLFPISSLPQSTHPGSNRETKNNPRVCTRQHSQQAHAGSAPGRVPSPSSSRPAWAKCHISEARGQQGCSAHTANFPMMRGQKCTRDFLCFSAVPLTRPPGDGITVSGKMFYACGDRRVPGGSSTGTGGAGRRGGRQQELVVPSGCCC